MKNLTFALSLLFVSSMFVVGQARLGETYGSIVKECNKLDTQTNTYPDGLTSMTIKQGKTLYIHYFDNHYVCTSTDILTTNKKVKNTYVDLFKKNNKNKKVKLNVCYVNEEGLYMLTFYNKK